MAPAAEPLHEQLTAWQHEFQDIFGRNTAKYFDDMGRFYFTKERFDLLYPSYGDSYPMFNGAIGMTIEQGGGGQAGRGGFNAVGDTVTLSYRIEGHYTAAMSAAEVTSQNASKLLRTQPIRRGNTKALLSKEKATRHKLPSYWSYWIKMESGMERQEVNQV